jgi:succinate dehydrogenase / fumarate reductase membrane anchor subunit
MHDKDEKMQSAYGRIHGLGSAKDGTGHWWAQRVTAVALLGLGTWFVYAVLIFTAMEPVSARDWLAQPLNSILLALFTLTALYHGQLGLQTVIEDYVHTHARKYTALVLVQFVTYGAMAAVVFAIAKISLGV